MCEPSSTTMLVSSLAMTALSTGMGMYAQYEQGKQAARAATSQAEYTARLLENDKAQSMAQAQNALAKGEAEADRQRRQAARAQGETASMLASSGFALDSGSTLSMLAEGAQEAQYDNAIIRHNTGEEAWLHQTRAIAAGNEQQGVLAAGANAASGAKTGALFGMGTSLLSGMGQGLTQYSDWKKTQPGKGSLYELSSWNTNLGSFGR